MSSNQNGHPKGYESSYGQFAWSLMCARPAIETLFRLGNHAGDDHIDVGSPQSTEEAIIGMIAEAGQSVRSEVNAIVGHNATGAAFQIVYSLFETYVASLGLKPGVEIRAGTTIGSERFTRVLWAARSAFAHGDEWRRKGAVHPLGMQAHAILVDAGIEDPAQANLAEVYALMSGGSLESFSDRLHEACRELGESVPTAAPSQSGAGTVILLVGLVLIALGVNLLGKTLRPIDGTVLMQVGEGDEAITVPVAAGKVSRPWQLASALREEAVKRLSSRAAAPYVEFDARVQAWFGLLDVLLKTDVESSGYHREMMDLCYGAMDLYRRRAALPNPLQRLANERNAITKPEFHRLVEELIAARGFTPQEYREPSVDLQMLSDSLMLSTESTPSGEVE